MIAANEVRLKSGRKFFYQEFGNPHGEAIIFFHGFPGSSAQGSLFKNSQWAQLFRVIAFDRPGFGNSDFLVSRKLNDIVEDVDALINQLQIETFHLLAVSGGSPYAMAVAAALPKQARSLNLMCPLGPIYKIQILKHLSLRSQILLVTVRFLPGLIRKVMNTALASQASSKNEGSIVEKFSTTLSSADHEILNNPNYSEVLSESLQHAFNQGPEGPLQELKIFTTKWKIDFSRIVAPTTILHGSEDRIVPPSVGKYLAQQIAHCAFFLIPNEGHYSLPINHIDMILVKIAK